MTAAKIKKSILGLDLAIKSPSTDKEYIPKFEEAKAKLQKDLAKLEEAQKQVPKTSPKSAKSKAAKAAKQSKVVAIQKEARKNVDSAKAILAGLSKEVKDFNQGRSKAALTADARTKGKPAGYRFKGDSNRKPTAAEIIKGLKDGTVYKEDRPEHSDINRKSKPYLAKGGEVGKFKLELWDNNDKFNKYESKPKETLYFQDEEQARDRMDLNENEIGKLYEKRNGKWLNFATRVMAKGGKLSNRATYVPNRDVALVTTESGKTFKAKDILDGIYIKGKNKQFEDGGSLHKYKLGDKWRSDFDFEGMYQMAIESTLSWGSDKLKSLASSFESVNEHDAAKPLFEAIGHLKSGEKDNAEKSLQEFHKEVKNILEPEYDIYSFDNILDQTEFSDGLKESLKGDLLDSGYSSFALLKGDTEKETEMNIREKVNGFSSDKNTYLQAAKIAKIMHDDTFKKGGKLSKRATYVPNRDVVSVTTASGKTFKAKDILDGIYIKGKDKKFEEGGEVEIPKDGVVATGTMQTEDGEITGELKWNDYWGEYQLYVDGSLMSTYRKEYLELAIDDFEKTGFYEVKRYAKGGKLSNRATYVPNRDIASITTESGKTFSHKNIIDGVYIRGKNRIFEDGGKIEKKYDTLWYATAENKGDGDWRKQPQKEMKNITWSDAVQRAIGIAKELETEVRLSTSEGFNNSGYYFHHQSYEKGGKLPEKGTPDWHQYQIAKDTVKNPNKSILGGMSVGEAKEIVEKYEQGGAVGNKPNLKFDDFFYKFCKVAYIQEPYLNNALEKVSVVEANTADDFEEIVKYLEKKNVPYLVNSINKKKLIMTVKNTPKHEQGGYIKNQYIGKTAEKVWDEWTIQQREHFLLDHSELLDTDRVNNAGETSSRIYQRNKPYGELTELTKRVLLAHTERGQYEDGGKLSNVAKVLIISSSNPLSTQLQKETGDSYNAIDFDDIEKGNPLVIKHKKTGKYFIVYTTRYIDSIENNILIVKDLSRLKDAYSLGDIEFKTQEQEFARGGFVGKGEMVWGKISSAKKSEFLHQNFTPQITPRSQEILVGKSWNFLPKSVKIKFEAEYANVEEYAKGGAVEMSFSAEEQEGWSVEKSKMYDAYANAENQIIDLKDELKRAKLRRESQTVTMLESRIRQNEFIKKQAKDRFDKYGKGGKLSNKATYVPNREIASITTESGKTFSNKNILDGVYIKGRNKKFEDGGAVDNDEDFIVHGYYTISNSGGYEVMLDESGDAARVRESFAGSNPKTSDWIEIEYVEDENGEDDGDGKPLVPVIDPNGYNIPLNMVMRAGNGSFAKGGEIGKSKKYYVEYLNELGVPDYDHPENDGRVPWTFVNRYGEWLRKNDSIGFEVGYSDWVRERYAKGGKLNNRGAWQNAAQTGDRYSTENDSLKSNRAKPAGWRYTNAGAARLRVDNPQGYVSKAHIDKYKGLYFTDSKNKQHRYIYQERREEKSDIKRNAPYLEDGGQIFNTGGEVDKLDYMMLSRLQMDNDYFLGNGNRAEKHLWAGNVDDQISEMKRIWNELPEDKKPEWLSMEDILSYEKQMKAPYSDNSLIDFSEHPTWLLKNKLETIRKEKEIGNFDEKTNRVAVSIMQEINDRQGKELADSLSGQKQGNEFDNGGAINCGRYPISNERNPVLESGIIVNTKGSEADAIKYISDKPDLFYEESNGTYLIKKK